MKEVLSLECYQQQVDKWIKAYSPGYFNPLTNACQLTEEVGEVVRLISRGFGEQTFKPNEEHKNLNKAIADEMADILFVITCMANDFGIDLSQALRDNLDKKTRRDSKRYQGDSFTVKSR